MISKEIAENLKNSSWIRKMFSEGAQLRAEFGEENVFDFSLGNPFFEPPKTVTDKLKSIVNDTSSGSHRYMDNAGFKDVRQKIADNINKDIDKAISGDHVLMTVGAAGALNVVLKTILNPNEEVIIIAPYFAEYLFYIKNHRGIPVVIKSDSKTFEPDLDELAQVINEKTRAIIINSPNNPTGVIYSQKSLQKMSDIIEAAEKKYDKAIFLLADEPYKTIVYDNAQVPNVHNIFRNSIMVNSYSKSLGLAGERIGYIALNSKIEASSLLMEGLAFSNRTLGFVNAPALWQKVIADTLDSSVDISEYAKRRDVLYKHLTELGFEIVEPKGAFYLFPKALIEDDVEFVKAAKKYNILLVPGSGFGCPGYFRASYCVDMKMIERALPAFTEFVQTFKKDHQ